MWTGVKKDEHRAIQYHNMNITKEETNSDIPDHPACNLSFGENSVSIFFCSFRKVKEVKVDLRCIFTDFFPVSFIY